MIIKQAAFQNQQTKHKVKRACKFLLSMSYLHITLDNVQRACVWGLEERKSITSNTLILIFEEYDLSMIKSSHCVNVNKSFNRDQVHVFQKTNMNSQ